MFLSNSDRVVVVVVVFLCASTFSTLALFGQEIRKKGHRTSHVGLRAVENIHFCRMAAKCS